jgi:hypothetical protein
MSRRSSVKVPASASRAAPTASSGVAASGAAAMRVGQQPAVQLLAREQHLPLVREVPEEGGLGQPGPLGDLVDGGRVVALLGEQVERGAHEALPRVRFPSSHGYSIGDVTW